MDPRFKPLRKFAVQTYGPPAWAIPSKKKPKKLRSVPNLAPPILSPSLPNPAKRKRVKCKLKCENKLIQKVDDLIASVRGRQPATGALVASKFSERPRQRFSGSFCSYYSVAETAITEPSSTLYSEDEDYFLDEWKGGRLFRRQRTDECSGLPELHSNSERFEA